ncbi:MAG: hypothetical protein ABSC93_13205 [Bryobacteraceae bacterium]|jgi:hypothetical protein
MKTVILFSIVAAGALTAQTTAGDPARRQAIPEAFRRFRIPPSAPLRFLASEEGRRFLRATGHPLAKAAILAFGEPAQTTVAPESWRERAGLAEEPAMAEAAATGCNGPAGTRFNLEPRPNAVPQNQASADFLLNRVGPNEDLIVQAANDWRGNLSSGVDWDQSVSGYYVHRSAAADCSVQFEGGLPALTFQGNTEMGTGNAVVAADPHRDAFYMADVRFGSASTGGVALFRAAASALLNPAACPNGTHTAAQAVSCWTATPPVLLFAQPVFDSVNDLPRIAVDQRAAGTGAGNVYVAVEQFDFSSYASSIALVACTPALNCSAPATVSAPASTAAAFPYVQVRADGLVTISFVNANADGSDSIEFATCSAGVPPQAPACSAPSLVTEVAHPIGGRLVNINLQAWTYPKHASRSEAGGAFTSFLAYEDCKDPFTHGNPPSTVCLNAEVLMTVSTNNGRTWSAPASADTSTGHHFYPAMAVDASTATVHLTYYSAAGDKFNHELRVLRNQVAPGSTTLGTSQFVTQVLDPIDGDPQSLGFFQSDFFMGAIARGTGKPGQSRLYTSFDSTVVPGTYQGRPDAEQNNHIGVVVY